MKKLLLSSFVVLTFIIYSYHTRHDGSAKIIKAPLLSPSTSAPQSGSSSIGSGASASGSAPAPASSTSTYKDGQYTGSVADAYYGYIQVLAVINGGRLTDVRFLQYPNDQPNSVAINSQAMPYLKQEALQAQNANVNVISGATDTSQAFVQSLSAALSQAT